MTAEDRQEILKALTDFRVEVARSHARFETQIGAMKSHENRIQTIERNMLTRKDIEAIVQAAIDAARRPSWRDVGALIAAIGTSVAIAVGVMQVLS